MLAVIEAPVIFLFQSLVKQMFVVIVEAVPPQALFKKDHLIYTRYKCEEE